jgi:hypothetical protein
MAVIQVGLPLIYNAIMSLPYMEEVLTIGLQKSQAENRVDMYFKINCWCCKIINVAIYQYPKN